MQNVWKHYAATLFSALYWSAAMSILKRWQYICETPSALVSLVDEDRQWFKSRVGSDFNQTPRFIGFCAHAMANAQTLIFEGYRATSSPMRSTRCPRESAAGAEPRGH